ncbi:carboxylic ester hydrolase-19 [Coleophoma cylindrospora]|uniref:Carboxylic ester hydrolase n=1 Tax=Coleophoma cylindrospora TaxID=1849047 RepID=A0A3D8QDP9_9HELO|nr:carboxylic ester hydrolase-19 [Coleophoma cylindrospora]
MFPQLFSVVLLASASLSSVSATPYVVDKVHNISYQGITSHEGVETFLNIQYGVETSGPRRFAPPEPFVLPAGSVYNATVTGPVCPQPLAGGFAYQSNATDQSEDCLRLKVARPASVNARSKLPVMVYIYGGGLFNGHINERTTVPDGLILESVENGLPIIYVAMNYRLNIFGFALSEALRSNNSLNAGLRDQRLALEWVQENIALFGGDPDRVTIFGQSSGALSVALQIMAYGGAQPTPFHGAIMESTVLEPTMTSNLTRDTFSAVAEMAGCSSGDSQSPEALECLRGLSMESLLNITLTQQDSTSSENDGDTYLPTVDGDFLPVPASQLVKEGRFTQMPIIMGWMQDDATLFTPSTIETESDTVAFLQLYYKGFTNATIEKMLSLYPTSDFQANTTANLSAEFYRSARMFRDILLTCPAFYFGHAMSQKCKSSSTNNVTLVHGTGANSTTESCPGVYIYNHNQTILDGYLDSIGDLGLGIIHTSDLSYVFGNLSLYNISSAFHPSKSDYLLKQQMSRSWSSFATTGKPSLGGNYTTLPGWESSYSPGTEMMDATLYVSGGPEGGMSPLAGAGTSDGVAWQNFKERCGFLNSDEVIQQLEY